MDERICAVTGHTITSSGTVPHGNWALPIPYAQGFLVLRRFFVTVFLYSVVLVFVFTQERALSLVLELLRLPQRHLIWLRMKNRRLFTAAQCVAKTSLTPLNFSATYALTQERGLSPAPCVRSVFQRRGFSWSMKGSTLGRSHSHALSVRNDLPARGSSGYTGGHTLASGRITAPSAWRAFLVTGTWKHT